MRLQVVLSDLLDSTVSLKKGKPPGPLSPALKTNSEAAARKALDKMNTMSNLNVVVINARKIADYDPNNLCVAGLLGRDRGLEHGMRWRMVEG